MNIFSVIKDFFVSIFHGIFTPAEIDSLKQSLKNFLANDVAPLAVDAVGMVEILLPGASGVAKKDAAIAQLISDAAKAGKDLTVLGASTLNWFIESSIQAIHDKLTSVSQSAIDRANQALNNSGVVAPLPALPTVGTESVVITPVAVGPEVPVIPVVAAEVKSEPAS